MNSYSVFLYVYLGLGAQIVIFTVVVVQMGVNNDINIHGFQIESRQRVFEFENFKAALFFGTLGDNKLLQPGVY